MGMQRVPPTKNRNSGEKQMPYYFDAYEPPKAGDLDPDHFWESWETIKNDLEGVIFETQDDALSERLRESTDQHGLRYLDWRVARYRKSDDRDMLKRFHQIGLEALDQARKSLEKGNLDTRFIYYWGMLSACHGYVLAACLAQGNDLASERAGAASREATGLHQHKRWFAHYYLRERPNHKNREQTLAALMRLVDAITDGEIPAVPPGQQGWFERFLSLDEHIRGTKEPNPSQNKFTKTFRKELTEKEMKKLSSESTDGLPPLDLEIPPS